MAATRKKPTARKSPTAAQIASLQREVEAAELRARREGARARGAIMAALSFEAGRTSRFRRDKPKFRGRADYNTDESRLEEMRQLSRWMDANSGPVAGIIDAMVDAVVGVGLHPSGIPDDARDWWNAWEPDCRAMASGGELQGHTLRSMFIDGDNATIMLRGGTLQLIESERIRSPYGRVYDETMRSGVEIDRLGKPRAFWIDDYNENGSALRNDPRAVRASKILYLARRRRHSMTRGVPLAASVLTLFEDLDEFIGSTTVAAKISTIFAILIKTSAPGAMRDSMAADTGTTDGGSDSREIAAGNPGGVFHLAPGEEIEQVDPRHPGPQFEPYVDRMLRLGAAGTRLPVEVSMLDNSRANFSVSRMARLQAADVADPLRAMFVANWLMPAYRFRMARGVLAGEVRDTPEVWSPKFNPPRQRFLDPQKEADAIGRLLDRNLTTLEDALGERGIEWGPQLEQRSRERERERQLGVDPAPLPGAAPTPTEPEAEPTPLTPGLIDDAEPIVAGAIEASDTALNGAQITALQQIVQSVVDGMLPSETAAGMIAAAFPTIDDAAISRMLDPAATFTPAPTEPAR